MEAMFTKATDVMFTFSQSLSFISVSRCHKYDEANVPHGDKGTLVASLASIP